ncbi:transposase InsO family protein [Bradyrhizobium sp. USDA 328]
MDLFSRKIAGWAMQDHMQVELASAALAIAINQQRPQTRLIHHSDRCVQLTRLSQFSPAGIVASISRKADYNDNLAASNLNSRLNFRLCITSLQRDDSKC